MPGSSEIEECQFGLLGEEDHEKQAEIFTTTYEFFNGSMPVAGGMYDLHMGTTDHHFRCPVCMREKGSCPSHAGADRLRTPVSSPVAINEIRRWLRVTCQKCSAPLEDPQGYRHVTKNLRLVEAALAATEGARCGACGHHQPKIVKDKEDHFSFRTEVVHQASASATKTVTSVKLSATTIRAWFERITDATVTAFGRDLDVHPRKMILNTIQVPGNGIRPAVRSFSSGSNTFHDLTNLLMHLKRASMGLPERRPEAPDEDYLKKEQNINQLYHEIILGSASTSATQGSSGKRGIVVGTGPSPAVLRRLPRKSGRCRKNLLGKRVVFISRSTISGNTSLRPNQVGVPIDFARELQVAVVVQTYNRAELTRYFLNGRRAYPGSTRVVRRGTQDTYDVGYLTPDFQLELGDTLYRDIVTGDQGFFNRQPTLEKSSICLVELIVIEDPTIKTFQMNVLACPYFNADFSGVKH